MKLKLRILSVLLVVCTIMSAMPMDVFATNIIKTENTIQTEKKTETSSNYDGSYAEIYFESNGGLECNSISVLKGTTVDYLPIPQKLNNIFMGWYTTSNFKEGTAFTKDSQVSADKLTLYAKYFDIENPEKSINTNFTKNDQPENISFKVKATEDMSVEDVKKYISLSCMDGSNSIVLSVSKVKDSYSIVAKNGFKKGSGYVLSLDDDRLFFDGQEKTVRTCSFNIKKDEVNTLEYNNGIVFVKDTEIEVEAAKKEEIFAPLISVDKNGDSVKKHISGEFTYKGKEKLEAGNVVCVYTKNKPSLKSTDINSDNKVAYLKILSIDGNKISYVEPELQEILYMPELIPFNVDGVNIEKIDAQGDAGCLIGTSSAFNIDAEDFKDAYDEIYGVAYNNASTPTLNEGDYIILFDGKALSDVTDIDVASASYGKITDIDVDVEDNKEIVKIVFEQSSKKEYDSEFDLYESCDITSDEMITDEEKVNLEKQIAEQLSNSDFYDKTTTYLANVAMATDGFQNKVDTKVLGQYVAGAQQGSVSIKNKKIDVEITGAKKLQGGDTRCVVTLSFDIVAGSGENQLVINIAATFEEELGLDFNPKSSKDGSIYNIGFDFDVKNYTGFSLESTIQTKENSQKIDIAKEMKDLMSALDEDESTAGIGSLTEEYHNLMQNETDLVTLVDKRFVTIKVPIIEGLIEADFYANFVVSADVNVALGCGFNYQNGKEYSVMLKVDTGSISKSTCHFNQRQTIDEVFEFNLYCMGTIELRAGIKIGVDVGVISTSLASLGFSLEVGAYTKLYGLFYYTYRQVNGVGTSEFTGNMFIEIGIYLGIDFNYNILIFGGSVDIYETQFPLITVGSQHMLTDPYIGDDTEYNMYIYKTAPLNEFFTADKLDMKTGEIEKFQMIDSTAFDYESSSPYVKIKYGHLRTSGPNGIPISLPAGHYIEVTPPPNVYEVEADVLMTLKNAGFSSTPYTKTIHVYWTGYATNTSVINFHSNGGNYVSSVRANLDSETGELISIWGEMGKPEDPFRYGYEFDGWYVDEACTIPYYFPNMEEELLTKGGKKHGSYERDLYAKWKDGKVSFDVSYYFDGIGQAEYSCQKVTRNTTVSIDDLYKEFEGYELNREYSTTEAVTITEFTHIDEPEKLSFRLYYTPKEYTVNYDSNGGSIITADGSTNTYERVFKYGRTLYSPSIIRPGYTFDGWVDENGKELPATMPSHNVTAKAKWKLNTYTAKFSSINTTQEVTCNDLLKEPTNNMELDGYTFLGWYTYKSSITPFDFTKDKISIDTVFYPKWKANEKAEYTVYHYSAGDLTQEEMENNNYTKEELLAKGCILLDTDTFWSGCKIITPQVKYFDGYETPLRKSVVVENGKDMAFKYFYTSMSGDSLITFDANGGEGGDSYYCQSEDDLKSIVAPTVTRDGYTFVGWSNKLSEAQFGQNMILKALWKQNDYEANNSTEVNYTVDGDNKEYTGSLASAIAEAKSGKTVEITLLKDIVTEDGYSVKGNVTIDGNGYSIYTKEQGILPDGTDNSKASDTTLFYAYSSETDPVTQLTLKNLDLYGGCDALIYIDNYSKVIMEKVSIQEISVSGGDVIISNNGGILIMKECNMQDCKSTSWASAIYNYGKIVMENCSIVNVECTGTLFSNQQGSSYYINNCTIANNSAEVLFAMDMGDSIIMNSTIVGNETSLLFNGNYGDKDTNGTMYLANSIVADNYVFESEKYRSSYFASDTLNVFNHVSNFKCSSLGDYDTLETLDGGTLFARYHLADNQKVEIPYLTKLDNGTYAAILSQSSAAISSQDSATILEKDEKTYFTYDETALDDDSFQKGLYFKAKSNEICSTGVFEGEQKEVTTYQNSKTRDPYIIGAIGATK